MDDFGSRYSHIVSTLVVNNLSYKFYDISKLEGFDDLPFCLRIILESVIRNCDDFEITENEVHNILNHQGISQSSDGIKLSYKPSRVVYQDFTGLPAVIDLACIREALFQLNIDPSIVKPKCLVDIILEHSVDSSRSTTQSIPNHGGGGVPQKFPMPSETTGSTTAEESCPIHSDVDCIVLPLKDVFLYGRPHMNRTNMVSVHIFVECQRKESSGNVMTKNQQMEFERNKERFAFLKWAANAFENIRLVPPGSGFMHQMKLECTTNIVISSDGWIYPDSLVGTSQHTPLVNGLGVLAFGTGAIETEAVILGQSFKLAFSQIVGCKLTGRLHQTVSSTDVVLAITKSLRQSKLSGKFVEFFGPGLKELSVSDRMTIANMCPEYALLGYFPIDEICLEYLGHVGRVKEELAVITEYLKAVKLLRDYADPEQNPVFSQVIEIDLTAVASCCSGPKRPQDRIPVSKLKEDFLNCLKSEDADRGFGIDPRTSLVPQKFMFSDTECSLTNGDVILAAITSCTNATNPSVMLAAGLVAKKATEAGLTLRSFVKASLSPGNSVAVHYLKNSKVLGYLEQIGFSVVGYNCPTCLQNSSSPLANAAVDAIQKGDIITVGVLAGSRNSESRVFPVIRANYLMSPMLVVAYALAGTVAIDFETEPIGCNQDGKPIFLREIWPSREEILETEQKLVIPVILKDIQSKIEFGTDQWNKLDAPCDVVFPWNSNSTYIKCPPFLNKLSRNLEDIQSIENACVLLNLGNDVSTDHISPAGSIARNTPAARLLSAKRLTPREFNSYGSRRGNDDVMVRSTFANIHLTNKFLPKPGPRTVHFPSGVTMDVFDAAERYKCEGFPLIILAGRNYGCGSSRDWAAKGPALLGIRAVLAESFDENHRSSLVGSGILPLQFLPGQTSSSLGLTGQEKFNIPISNENLAVRQVLEIKLNNGRTFSALIKLETEVELAYFRHGGILNYVTRQYLS